MEGRISEIIVEMTDDNQDSLAIKKMFRDEKRKFLKRKFPDIMSAKEKFSISNDDVIKWIAYKETGVKPNMGILRRYKDYEVTEEDVLGYLVEKHLPFQYVSSMSRMRELQSI